MEALTSPAMIPYLLRWAHIIFGIMWLGHLYFFNLVNVPFQGGLDKELKPKVNPALLLRAFYWFRWSAMYTLILGLACAAGPVWAGLRHCPSSHRSLCNASSSRFHPY